MSDTSAPVLLGLDLPSTIDLGASYGRLAATARARDPDGAGVRRVTLFFDRELLLAEGGIVRTRSLVIDGPPGSDNFGDATPGSATASYVVSPYAAPGTYHVVKAWVDDLDGNRAIYTGAQLEALGFDTALDIKSSIPDTAGPALLRLDLPDSVDVSAPRAELRVGGQLKDQTFGSGVLAAYVYFDQPLRTRNAAAPDLVLYPNKTERGGVQVDATGALDLAKDTAPGTYTVAKLVAVDWAGNRTTYSGAELAALGADTQFTVTGSVPVAPKASMSLNGGGGNIVLTFDAPAWHAGPSGFLQLEVSYDPTLVRFAGAAFTGRGGIDLTVNATENGSAGWLTMTRSSLPALDPWAQLVVTMEPVVPTGTYSFGVYSFRADGVEQKLAQPGLILYRGTAGDDVVARETIHDLIQGYGGIDTAAFRGERDDYVVHRFEGDFVVEHPDAARTRLTGVEHLAFSDRSVALDVDGIAGQAYRLYGAALGRAPDLDGLGYWISRMEDGVSLREVADAFIHDQEFIRLNGDGSDAGAFAARLYQNVLHRAPDAAGLAFWVAALEDGLGRADMLVQFSESAENVAQVAGQIQNGIDYFPW